eukprot:TRINITY_DN25342_c0_g1_i1.p1 TRINITY_DN25342_c0_g1~~TRINITY_DN25342_c0_g1_i1.p1  ORF type:complete len:110 (-),score=22.80 TRINITY_DN25342_c0_g1_i1:82-375(-)
MDELVKGSLEEPYQGAVKIKVVVATDDRPPVHYFPDLVPGLEIPLVIQNMQQDGSAPPKLVDMWGNLVVLYLGPNKLSYAPHSPHIKPLIKAAHARK